MDFMLLCFLRQKERKTTFSVRNGFPIRLVLPMAFPSAAIE